MSAPCNSGEPKDRPGGLTAAAAAAEELRSTLDGRAQAALAGDRRLMQELAQLTADALAIVVASPTARFDSGIGSRADRCDTNAALTRMGEAMVRIATGEEPNRVLGWTRARRGRPPRMEVNADRLVRDDLLIAEVEDVIEMQGITVDAACELVAAKWKDDPQRLVNLYRRR